MFIKSFLLRDEKGRLRFLDKNILPFLGYGFQDLKEKDSWMGKVHPGDRKKALSLFSVNPSGLPAQAEYRFLFGDQKYRKIREVFSESSGEGFAGFLEYHFHTGGKQPVFIKKDAGIPPIFGQQNIPAFLTGKRGRIIEMNAPAMALAGQDIPSTINIREFTDRYGLLEQSLFLPPGISGRLFLGRRDTEDQQDMAALREKLEMYKIMTGSNPENNIFLFDRDNRFVLAEGSELEQRTGMKNSDFTGSKIGEIKNKKLRTIFKPLMVSSLKGNDVSLETELNGEHYFIRCMPVNNDRGGTRYGIAFMQDISEYKHITDQLKKAKKTAEEANAEKSRFFASITHDLRTPLNAIIGFSEQLRKTDLSPRQEEYVKVMEKSSEHLLNLINEILTFSRIEAGRISLDNEVFLLKNLARDVYDTMKIKVREKRLGFDFVFRDEADFWVIGDPFRVKQILINLLNNALKFTENGSVGFEIRKSGQTKKRAEICFIIRDTGIGIPEDKLQRIFRQFQQADSTITKKYGGTGMGLTISKNLTEMMGGHIHVRSKPGKGSVFTLTLPFNRPGKDQLPEKEEFVIDYDLLRGRPVLIVDDDSVNRLLGKVILEGFNADVDIANGGKEAMKKLEKNHYDVVLLDIQMPGLDGFEVAEYLRGELGNRKTRIIAVTAAALQKDIRKFHQAGMDDFLFKPFRETSLFKRICRVLNIPQETSEKPTKKSFAEGSSPSGSPAHGVYDLGQLEKVTRGYPEFFNEMIRTFMNNAREGTELLKKYAEQENWEQVRELCHRLLPSYRHLEINHIISDLNLLRGKIKKKEDPVSLLRLIDRISEGTSRIITQLQDEIK